MFNFKAKNKFLNYSEKKRVPKSAQDVIPFTEVYDNGLFLTCANDTYALIYSFDNIDYSLLRDDGKAALYEKYKAFLNSLPSDIRYQEFIYNNCSEKSRLVQLNPAPLYGGEISSAYKELNEYFIKKSEARSSEKVLIGALSYKAASRADNVNVIFKYFREIQDLLIELGSNAKQLLPEEVFKLLFDFYHPFSNESFKLPKNIFARGDNFKDYIAPSSFVFTSNQIKVGSSFSRVLFLKSFDREADDRFLSDLLENNHNIAVSKFVRRIDKGEALELLRKEIFDIQAKIQERKAKNKKDGGDFIPFRYTERLTELEDLQNKLSGTSCELFEICLYVCISAATSEDLEELTKAVNAKALKHQVMLGTLLYRQREALSSVLPFGINYFSADSGSSLCTHLLSDAAAVLIPFSSCSYFSPNGLNYGVNQITNDLILLDRTNELNSNGWILGTSGSGKSVVAKSEFLDAVMKYPDDEFIIVDPENEYAPLIKYFDGEIFRLSPDSKTSLNIFDIDLSYTENGFGAIAMKSEMIMTVVETALCRSMTSIEKSITDRCVRLAYANYKDNAKASNIPTLTDFYEILKRQPDKEAMEIATALELYVVGSFKSFAGKTNIEINKRVLLIDIFNMGEQLRTVGLQIILEFLWQRVIKNKEKGVRTWIWIDEFSVMFNDGAGRSTTRSGEFFEKVYQRIRKHGGVITGITQNITTVLSSPQAKTMLSNAEFCILLQQKTEDLKNIIAQFDLSPAQSKYLTSGKVGTGLIICGNKVIPFDKTLDKNNLIYKIISTKFKEN